MENQGKKRYSKNYCKRNMKAKNKQVYQKNATKWKIKKKKEK